ncbi:MAG: ABC transporter ATP-binding protein [Syntrophaceae bacterium]|nr:ABC transporter ATP-binding protein [Syntrophaceae bacterium]
MAILELKSLSKFFGHVAAVSDLTLSVKKGEITSLIGPNGAGKTTFYNVVTGKFPPTAGKIFFNGEDITGLPPFKVWEKGISRSFQITNIFKNLTVLENIRTALIVHMGKSLNFFRPVDQYSELHEKSLRVLKLIGLEDRKDTPCHAISHGDMRIVEVGIVLASEPKLIFLDEPTAGMNPTETMRMVNLIKELYEKTSTTFFITEHDMNVVFAISHRIIVLDRGKMLADGTPEEIRNNLEVKKAYLGGLKQ